MAKATIWADSRAAAAAVSSGRALLLACLICATLNPAVKALTMDWSAAESNGSRPCPPAEGVGRCRERTRASAIHCHCSLLSDLPAAVRNCPASVALSAYPAGPLPALATALWPAACRSGDTHRRYAWFPKRNAGPSIAYTRKRPRIELLSAAPPRLSRWRRRRCCCPSTGHRSTTLCLAGVPL